ncbi:MAG: nodulation protein NfeD [Firmicutes bacterium]|jgi:membrane-bound serine protease (ClpP class)|nr:nodulation protein NfeD [Bacillota bacterium]
MSQDIGLFFKKAGDHVNRIKRSVVLLVLAVIVLTIPQPVLGARTGPVRVYVLPIHGEIEPGLAAFVARGITLAERNDGIVLLEINTFGGRVDAATEIKDIIVRAEVPVIAYVSERAWSAGALITLAAPQIAMAPGSSIGAAEPRPLEEKSVSALRAEFEATAGRSGRDPRVAAAMVDADVAIDGLVEKGKILTLSAADALSWGFSDVTARNRYEALGHYGYDEFELIHLEPHWAESIARFVTNSTMSSLLLTLGFLGLVVEITTPGWGVPGTAGVVSLALFFGGRYIVGLAGFEEIALFVVGILLLLLEIFVVPGFGVTGVLGIVAVIGSILLVFGDLKLALMSLVIALSASIVALILLWRRLGKTRLWKGLVLSHTESKEKGYRASEGKSDLVGRRGRTLTPLRPAGTLVIGEERYDVISEGSFIEVDRLVEVIEVEGSKIVVREIN